MKWIRIATTIGSDPSIGKMADFLKIRVAECVGLVSLTLAQLPEHARNGCVSDVPDNTLERWSTWHGKRGLFAQAFRSNLCDDNGLVRAWEKHNGAAIRKADDDRERQKKWRHNASVTRDITRDATRDVARDGTGRDVTTPTTTTAAAHFSRFEDEAACSAYAGFRRAHSDPSAFDRAVASLADPPSGNGFGWTVVGSALSEMAANGASWNVQLARGYCARVKAGPPAPRPVSDESKREQYRREFLAEGAA